jgi:hypothetical protein
MEPQNNLIGDITGVELPHMNLEKEVLVEEKKMAKYSKTKEFKRIKEHCEDRIKFYQHYLPNGTEVALDVRPTAEDWAVANRVIGELKALMNMYQIASEAVKENEDA